MSYDAQRKTCHRKGLFCLIGLNVIGHECLMFFIIARQLQEMQLSQIMPQNYNKESIC